MSREYPVPGTLVQIPSPLFFLQIEKRQSGGKGGAEEQNSGQPNADQHKASRWKCVPLGVEQSTLDFIARSSSSSTRLQRGEKGDISTRWVRCMLTCGSGSTLVTSNPSKGKGRGKQKNEEGEDNKWGITKGRWKTILCK